MSEHQIKVVVDVTTKKDIEPGKGHTVRTQHEFTDVVNDARLQEILSFLVPVINPKNPTVK